MPTADPDGKPFSASQRAELIDFCEAHRDQFLSSCPALAVEDAMTAARTANPSRKPQRSDGIDLMHAVIALAYCDYFLLRDGFVRACAEQAARALRPTSLARVYDDPAALVRDLNSPVKASFAGESPGA